VRTPASRSPKRLFHGEFDSIDGVGQGVDGATEVEPADDDQTTTAKQLDAKLREWTPETAAQVQQRVTVIMILADPELLEIMRSRAVGQEVSALLDAKALQRSMAC
jgi:hypothetical protein